MNYLEGKHLVVDIETFGEKAGCPIIQIGYCTLNPKTEKLETQWQQSITEKSNTQFGLTNISKATMQWWSKRPDVLQGILDDNPKPLDVVLKEFVGSIPADISFFWSKSPNFDFAILEYACEACGVKVPWRFWQLRDIRTIEDESMLPKWYKKNGHTALADALNEALILVNFLKIIRFSCNANYV